jgi:transposase
MVDIEFIRKKHLVDDWPIRKISRQLGISRQAVRRALSSSDAPRYHLAKPRACPVMDPFRQIITTWLTDDQKAPPKQRHTAKRIYDRLVGEYKFKGAESTVRQFVAQLRPKVPEVFIPLQAAWGQQAQIDWGQATVRIAGGEVVAHLFCLRMRASSVPFAWAAPTEKLEAFLEGHARGFAWLGGVPAECLYDNPKTAVVRILAGPERQEHTLFSSLRSHYLFDSHFCRPAQAHEKGSVENLVGYVRRNALVPVPDFASWDELNAHLLAWSERERDRLKEAWDKEQAGLRPLPKEAFHCALVRLVVVSRLSLVSFDHNRYSVPCRYVGQNLRLLARTSSIEVWDGQEKVAEHKRCYDRSKMLLQVEHYLPALARKPHAASHAAVVSQMPAVYGRVRDELCQKDREGYRKFVEILLLHREFSAKDVQVGLEEAERLGCLDGTSVRQLVLNRVAPAGMEPIPVPERLAYAKVNLPDLSDYDRLLREGVA